MKRVKTILGKITFILAVIVGAVSIANAGSKDAVLKALAPDTPDSLTETAISGLYEVIYGAQVFYISDDGRYIFSGNIVDLVDKVNLTEQSQKTARKALLKTIPNEDLIAYPVANKKHTITVFTDIDCPYCQRMHNEQPTLAAAGVELRYLLFPRAGKNSTSYNKSVTVWCSKDKQQAMTDAKAGKKLSPLTCENPIDKHMELAKEFELRGTPTILLEDGTLYPGYLPAKNLLKIMAEM